MPDSTSRSALAPAGHGAEQIAELFYVMATGGVLIWLLVIGLAVYAILQPGKHPAKRTRVIVIGGGAIFPTVVLVSLLTYGLAMMPELQRPAPEGSQVIEAAGVRWWWRFGYRTDSGDVIETANEIHVPVDEEVEFKLASEDVIHSFWIPSLGGKTDMIPGRVNRLKLQPTKVGFYRGLCAEYCGTAHAMMSFDVIVEPRADFNRWLAHQAEPAVQTDGEGLGLFLKLGCGACHAIRGTDADGPVGPDLTHFGSRRTIGAAVLANTPENLARWIARTHAVKPGVEMPEFDHLKPDELTQLVKYLGSLQ